MSRVSRPFSVLMAALLAMVILAGVRPAIASPVGPGLYVISKATQQVLLYDNTTGTSYGVFASLGGTSDPRGMDIGPDGELWFADAGTGSIRSVGAGGVVTTRISGRANASDVDWDGNQLFVARGVGAGNVGIVESWNYPSFASPTFYTLAAGGASFINRAGYQNVESAHVINGFVRYSNPAAQSIQSNSTPNNFATWGAPSNSYDLEYRFEGGTDLYYATPQGTATVDLWKINASSGVNVNGILAPGAFHRMNYRDIAFDASGNTYLTSGTNDIVKYNVSTGGWSTFVSLGSGGLSNGQGLAWIIPEPASLSLCAVAGVVVLVRRRRQA
jgi:hypothetical protein